jgi:hypothetical protein
MKKNLRQPIRALSFFVAMSLIVGCTGKITRQAKVPKTAVVATGSVRGIIRDAQTGTPVVGATVLITGPLLSGSRCVISDENGQYEVDDVPVGVCQIDYYYDDVHQTDSEVVVAGSFVQHNQTLHPAKGDIEIVMIRGHTHDLRVWVLPVSTGYSIGGIGRDDLNHTDGRLDPVKIRFFGVQPSH